MSGWPRRKLSGVLRIQNGFAFDSKRFTTDGGTPLIRIRDLKNGLSTETNFDGPFDQQYVVRAGDFLIGMDGEFGCFEWRGSDALLNQRVCRLTGFDAGIEPRFLFYGINSYLKEIEDVTTFTTVKHLSSKQIANIGFPLPPLEEQQRIVAVLDEAFAAIATATANAEKNLANARELPSAQLTAALQDLGEIEDVPISEVTFIQEGPGIRKYEYQTDGFPMINVRCVQDGWIDMSKSRAANIELANGKWKHFQVQEGDILFTTSGTIGRCAIAEQADLPLLMNTSVVRFRSESDGLLQRFLYHFLRSDLFQKPLGALASGTAIANVGPTHIKTLSISIPPLERQRRIIQLLDETISLSADLVESCQCKLDALGALKQSLLHRAFSGKLTEREPLAA